MNASAANSPIDQLADMLPDTTPSGRTARGGGQGTQRVIAHGPIHDTHSPGWQRRARTRILQRIDTHRDLPGKDPRNRPRHKPWTADRWNRSPGTLTRHLGTEAPRPALLL